MCRAEETEFYEKKRKWRWRKEERSYRTLSDALLNG